MKRCCLVIVDDIKNNRVLMVQNNRGINKGFYNFPGGKIESGETIEDGSIRESIEETGITPLNLKTKGKIEFHPTDMIVYIYYTNNYSGDVKFNNEENTAFWVDRNNIPFDKMRSADKFWIKDVFSDKQINKRITFDEKFNVKKIEDINDNIEKYKKRYHKFLELRKNKYLHMNKNSR